MTDLDCIEYAVQVVLAKCRKADPYHVGVPANGGEVMEWFAAALREAKSIREPEQYPEYNRPNGNGTVIDPDFPCYCPHCRRMRAKCAPPVTREMTDGEYYLGVTH